MGAEVNQYAGRVFQPSLNILPSFFGWCVACFFLLFFLSIFAIFLAPFIIIIGTIYSYFRLKSTFIELKDDGIQIRAGVFFKSQSMFLYSKIQDISETQGIIERIFDLQSLSIKTMTIGSQMGGYIPGLKKDDAATIRDFVLKKLNKSFIDKAIENKDVFAQNVLADESSDSLKKNPYPMHFFKPLIYGVIWIVISIIAAIVLTALFPTVFLLFWFIVLIAIGIFGLSAIGAFLQSITLNYYVGKTRIEIVYKLLSTSKKVIPIFKVQDIVIFRDFWSRLVGLSSINIETGELLYTPSDGSKQQGGLGYGNIIPFLLEKSAVGFRSYVYGLLGYDLEEAHPAMVIEHPLQLRKVLKKSITGVIMMTIFLIIIAAFFLPLLMPIAGTTQAPGSSETAFGVFVICVLIYLGLVIWTIVFQYLYYKSYYYNISKSAIYVRKGVFSTSEIVLPFRKIQNVFVNQDLFDKILGLYDVHFSTVTTMSANLCHIDGLNKENAEEVKEILLTLVAGNNR